jgi:CelD/BcsL family acetyltransferase involved in cellulose biosynthesis
MIDVQDGEWNPPRKALPMSIIPNTPAGSLAPAPVEAPRWSQQVYSIARAEELGPFEVAWRVLGERMGSPIQRYDWAMACARVFGGSGTLRVEVVLRDGVAVGIAPLVYRPADGIEHAQLLGVAELHEPMDLICRDSEALGCLAEALLRRGTPLFFERLPTNSPTLETFRRLARGRAVTIVRPQPAYPYIPLDESWHEPEGHLNAGRRSDLRRARRRAEERGPISVQILNPRPEELDNLLSLAYEIEEASWKGKAGTALRYDAPRAEFYRRYAHLACEEGSLRLCFLRIAERAVAMQLAIECGGGFWLLKIGYDQQYAQCSPGQLLMRETIRYAAERKLQSYEFLGTAAAWTQVWTKCERESVSLWVYPMGVRGTAALGLRAARAIAHRWRGK